MIGNPRVAILVLNYNGATYLLQCLSSIKNLEYPNFQGVVIDNASTDNSFIQAKKDFPDLHFIQNTKNIGFGAGMNVGIKWAIRENFDFVWLLNSDTEIERDSLSLLMQAQKDHPQIEAMSPVIVSEKGKNWYAGGRINFWRMRVEHTMQIQSLSPYRTNFLTGCAPLFSISLLQQVGTFDERFFLYYEDADLSYRIRKFGKDLYVIPRVVISHREESKRSKNKIYYLVFSGLLFFALHTPEYLRFYMGVYVTIRKMTNRIKRLFGSTEANFVAKAYADFIKKYRTDNQLHLR